MDLEEIDVDGIQLICQPDSGGGEWSNSNYSTADVNDAEESDSEAFSENDALNDQYSAQRGSSCPICKRNEQATEEIRDDEEVIKAMFCARKSGTETTLVKKGLCVCEDCIKGKVTSLCKEGRSRQLLAKELLPVDILSGDFHFGSKKRASGGRPKREVVKKLEDGPSPRKRRRASPQRESSPRKSQKQDRSSRVQGSSGKSGQKRIGNRLSCVDCDRTASFGTTQTLKRRWCATHRPSNAVSIRAYKRLKDGKTLVAYRHHKDHPRKVWIYMNGSKKGQVWKVWSARSKPKESDDSDSSDSSDSSSDSSGDSSDGDSSGENKGGEGGSENDDAADDKEEHVMCTVGQCPCRATFAKQNGTIPTYCGRHRPATAKRVVFRTPYMRSLGVHTSPVHLATGSSSASVLSTSATSFPSGAHGQLEHTRETLDSVLAEKKELLKQLKQYRKRTNTLEKEKASLERENRRFKRRCEDLEKQNVALERKSAMQ